MTFDGQSEPDERQIRSDYDEVCHALNMDKDTAQIAWQSYQDIKLRFTLEGNHLHWLTCALFVTGKQSRLSTVGKGIQIGNCVSLSRLIKTTNLSLIEFFNKVDKWIDMAHLDREFRLKIDVIRRNFDVISIIYKKFEPIFQTIFKSNEQEGTQIGRRRLRHSKICSYQQIFNFCWNLYLLIKGQYPNIKTDLINSYHLLLCCIDLIYANVVNGNRRDLLNLQTEAEIVSDLEGTSSSPSIIKFLCKRYNGFAVEIKAIKSHLFHAYLDKLFEKNNLRGNKATYCGLLDQGNFDANNKFVSSAYEEFVLSSGDLDERIFLGRDAYLDIGTPAKPAVGANASVEARKNVARNLHDRFQNTMIPQTPLTGRNYLNQKEERTPVSSATFSVARLQAILAGWKTSPSEKLVALFHEHSPDLAAAVESRVKELKDTFYDCYTKVDDERSKSPINFAENRWNLGVALYYKTLESIILAEKRHNKTVLELKILLEKDVFHRSLLGCCLEITIFSYGSQKKFPWIVQVFGLSHYHFYKVIEVVIRTESGLPREVVKHLNYIEESILDHLAWLSGSPLFNDIDNFVTVPSYDEVCVTSNEEAHAKLTVPPVHPQMRRLNPSTSTDPKSLPVTERYSSPMKKRADTGDASKPKRTSSLSLFFRKFYYLASVRLKDLCRMLNLEDSLISKIWTCFEYSIIHGHNMMMDRHLDQLIMCAVYVICKVSKINKKFSEIKDCYNRQPQATKHLYRNVLIRKGKGKSNSRNPSPTSPPIIVSTVSQTDSDSNEASNMRSSSTLPQTPTSSMYDTDNENGVEVKAVRGDLVEFYNEVYLVTIKEFVYRFLPQNKNFAPSLSPLPACRSPLSSPRKSQVSGRHSVYVSSFNCDSPPQSPRPSMQYSFQESPYSILKDINAAVKQSVGAKRAILQDESDISPKRSRQSEVLKRRLSNLTSDKEKIQQSQNE